MSIPIDHDCEEHGGWIEQEYFSSRGQGGLEIQVHGSKSMCQCVDRADTVYIDIW